MIQSMKVFNMLVLLLLAAGLYQGSAQAADAAAQQERPVQTSEEDGVEAPGRTSPLRPVHTYSIVARDPKTGELGVAVQSHWFSVGSMVIWAEAGVGAVATQSFVNPAYGPEGLALMGKGLSAPEALRRLLKDDEESAVRQVAMVDARGNAAAHTGSLCIPAAGHHQGEGYTVQANLMLDEGVWPAMARAYETHPGDLADRLLAALEAAQEAGGDIRGRQSAALLVVRGQPTGRVWADRVFDLRVEDHPRPVEELKRLVGLARAYNLMNEGDEHVAAQRYDEALQAYAEAERMVPDNDEFIFWHAVALVSIDRLRDALPVFRRAFLMNPSWWLLIPRLVEVGLLPDDPEVTEAIQSMGPTPAVIPDAGETLDAASADSPDPGRR
jgi:uncharacterized Ntn-hydrolase superfamily protein